MKSHPRETLERMLTHIGYEISMFTQAMLVVEVGPTLQPFVQLPPADLQQLGNNMRIETLALHARNLAEFLLGYSGSGAVLARHYIEPYPLDKRTRTKIQDTQKRAHVQIAHISAERIGADKNWKLDYYYPVLDGAGDFAEKLLQTDWFDNVPDQRPVFGALLTNARTVSAVFKAATAAVARDAPK